MNAINNRRIPRPRVAVCFLAFDRHHLVRLTLNRVLRFKPPHWPLRIWQDGHRERHSGRIVGSAERIARNLVLYKTLGLEAVYHAGANDGPACNYAAAERWAFEDIGADICIFIEDDIVISRHFFTTMASLGGLALNTPQIGAFSAFGDGSIDWLAQWRQRHILQPMHHRWGYGITRNYWLRARQDQQDYLNLLNNADYRTRPDAAIRAWLRSLCNAAATSHITSQDGAKTAIMLKLGCFSIMTTPSYAVNIGKRGIHSFPEFFHANRDHIKGRNAFFPLPTSFSAALPQTASAQLQRASRHLAYW